MSAYSLYFLDEYDAAVAEIKAALPHVNDPDLQEKLIETLGNCSSEKETKKARETINRGIAALNADEYSTAANLFTSAFSETKDLKLRMRILQLRLAAYWVGVHVSPHIRFGQLNDAFLSWQPADLHNIDLFRKAHSDIKTMRNMDPDVVDDQL